MQTFTAVTDQALANTIARARSRLVLVAPGLAEVVASAISTLTGAQPAQQISLILDPDEDAYRRTASNVSEKLVCASDNRRCRVGTGPVRTYPRASVRLRRRQPDKHHRRSYPRPTLLKCYPQRYPEPDLGVWETRAISKKLNR